ncbi:hypothetical protein [Mycobacterium sp.]|uniref:hypothetical protein n=1 Tax=Mycobacterium sp. TaxID=1785 RepID=UPI003D0FEFB4
MPFGSAVKVWGTAVGITGDGVEDTASESVVVPRGVRLTDVLAELATGLDVEVTVVVEVIDDVRLDVVVVGAGLVVVVVTTESVVVTGASVVVVVVSVAGSATAGTTPRLSAVIGTASTNASSAAPQREPTRHGALIVAQLLSALS